MAIAEIAARNVGDFMIDSVLVVVVGVLGKCTRNSRAAAIMTVPNYRRNFHFR
jgi:hypothetical protein